MMINKDDVAMLLEERKRRLSSGIVVRFMREDGQLCSMGEDGQFIPANDPADDKRDKIVVRFVTPGGDTV
jgi:hypothetical protein